jgi:hypothetical protein
MVDETSPEEQVGDEQSPLSVQGKVQTGEFQTDLQIPDSPSTQNPRVQANKPATATL